MMHSYFSIPTGIDFEDELVDLCSRHFKADFKNYANTKKDWHEGVDVEIYRVGIDFTTNFSGKDHMEILPCLISGKFIDIKFGVRTANSHNGYTKFKTPVLVIGIDSDPSYVRGWMANIIDDFKRDIENIINVGQDAYWAWLDLHPEYD